MRHSICNTFKEQLFGERDFTKAYATRRDAPVGYKYCIFGLLFIKPLLILALALSMRAPPALSLQKRQVLHQQWAQRLYRQHDELTRLKLIYTRLPPAPRKPFDPGLARLHDLYHKAAQLLEQLKFVSSPQLLQVIENFHQVDLQIQTAQIQLSKLMSKAQVYPQ